MPKKLFTFEPVEKKEYIAEKALQLFMRMGIKTVTMDEIAAQAGVSKKTLYLYYADKETLVNELLNGFLDGHICELKIGATEASDAIEEYYTAVTLVIRDYTRIHPAAIHDIQKYYGNLWQRMQQHSKEFVRSFVEANLRRGIAEGLYRKDLNVPMVAEFYSVFELSLFHMIDNHKPVFNHVDLFREYITYHLCAITNDNGRKVMEKLLKKEFRNN
ncbi:MAG: TetR/AcrR family transcriptional regulator [Flavobacteriales bacterium]